MSIDVRWLPKHHIEDAALRLLEDAAGCGITIEVPIPVEAVLELHLKVNLGFANLTTTEGQAALGAYYPVRREVLIDQSLDPEQYPSKLHRCRYTIAHEAGHVVLHTEFLRGSAAQTEFLFPCFDEAPSVVLRETNARDPIEWQADYFAACFLMPRDSLRDAWRGVFGSIDPVDPTSPDMIKDLRSSPHFREQILTWEFERLAKPLANQFEVSVDAMRIRLEEVGLFQRSPQTLLRFE